MDDKFSQFKALSDPENHAYANYAKKK